MALPACDDEEFIRLFTTIGATEASKELGVSERSIYLRRNSIEKRLGRPLFAPNNSPTNFHPERCQLTIDDGVVLVASDAHYWPDVITTAHRAFLHFIKKLKPQAVVMNGDVFDGASISRHAPIVWESRPNVEEEIASCTDRLREIETAAKKARLIWTLGNHDARFESRLAQVAPEYAKVHGLHLEDHFPNWLNGWSLMINNKVMIKHRWKGGIHATHNNTLGAGLTMVTGHLHSLKVTPYADYNGTRWGVDTGTLADTHGPQFRDYTEDNPRNWRSGFAVLTFQQGKLRWPEVVHVVEPGIVEFRGEVTEV